VAVIPERLSVVNSSLNAIKLPQAIVGTFLPGMITRIVAFLYLDIPNEILL
jgi:hypothetical protein